MSTEAFDMTIKSYPKQVLMANARKSKPFKPTDKLPKKIEEAIQKNLMYWKDGKLIDTITKKIVPKNSKTAGTPRYERISGQRFWEGGESVKWYRQKLKDQLFGPFHRECTFQLPEKIFPPAGKFLQVEYIFYVYQSQIDNLGDALQDINNHSYPYVKVFADTLVEMKIIDTDAPKLLRGDYYRFVVVPEIDEQRLQIKFHFCRNGEPISYD